MRRILEAFAATSIPTGTFLLLLAMGSMGSTPGLAAVSAEAPVERWASLQLPPPMALELELESPDAPSVLAAAQEAPQGTEDAPMDAAPAQSVPEAMKVAPNPRPARK